MERYFTLRLSFHSPMALKNKLACLWNITISHSDSCNKYYIYINIKYSTLDIFKMIFLGISHSDSCNKYYIIYNIMPKSQLRLVSENLASLAQLYTHVYCIHMFQVIFYWPCILLYIKLPIYWNAFQWFRKWVYGFYWNHFAQRSCITTAKNNYVLSNYLTNTKG